MISVDATKVCVVTPELRQACIILCFARKLDDHDEDVRSQAVISAVMTSFFSEEPSIETYTSVPLIYFSFIRQSQCIVLHWTLYGETFSHGRVIAGNTGNEERANTAPSAGDD